MIKKKKEMGRNGDGANVFRITKWHYLEITSDSSFGSSSAVAGLAIRVNRRVIKFPPAILCGSAEGVLGD